VGGKQLYVINVIDNVLVALFAIMGDGLAPFRAWDTYNMIPIAYYHHKSWKLRKKKRLPDLDNKNDLPTKREEEIGIAEEQEGYYTVLTQKQQDSLQKHIDRYQKSHTFYKPHETTTHFAFPIAYLIAIQTLVDCHSLFQIALGSVTWGISYHTRPPALTTVILCCSICCNITAGILITVGDHKTRKKDVIERMFRQELTEKAIHKVEKKRQEREETGEEPRSPGERADVKAPVGQPIPEEDRVEVTDQAEKERTEKVEQASSGVEGERVMKRIESEEEKES
jgi:hypothetical protein